MCIHVCTVVYLLSPIINLDIVFISIYPHTVVFLSFPCFVFIINFVYVLYFLYVYGYKQ